MNGLQIIHEICEAPIPVAEMPECEFSAGMVHHGSAGVQIYLREPLGRDGYSLAVAAHEAFHVRRMIDCVAYYSVPPVMVGERQRVEEELTVNRLAREWLLPRLTTDAERQAAEQCFYESETSYVDRLFWVARRALRDCDRSAHPMAPNVKVQILTDVLNLGPKEPKTPREVMLEAFEQMFGDPASFAGDAGGDTDGDTLLPCLNDN